MKYRREIDGLRALAVLPVILFHAGFTTFKGGFVGVDIFFVISGYLITTILMSDFATKKFTLTEFYERRARRILPALFFVILCCLPFASVLTIPLEIESFCKSLLGVLLFASNIHFYQNSGYFAPETELQPLLHTWSLAVEEQFYLFFPLLIGFIYRFGLRKLTYVFGAIFVSSFVISEWQSTRNISAGFYLLPSRAWELMLGSFVAILHIKKPIERYPNPPLLAQIGSFIGLALICFAIFAFSEETPFPGRFALLPTIGAALIIHFARRGTFVGKLLSRPFLVGIGLISYSAYLWHQPLFAFMHLYLGEQPAPSIMLGLVAACMCLAFVTWKFIETPFRNRQAITSRHIFAFAGYGSLVLLIVAGAGSKTPVSEWVAKSFATPAERLMMEKLKAAISTAGTGSMYDNNDCHFWSAQLTDAWQKRFDVCVEKYGPALIVLGDSHGMDLYNAIATQSDRPFIASLAAGYCRPGQLKHECAYAKFERFVVSERERIGKVIFTQSGDYFYVKNSSRFAPDFLNISTTYNYLKKIAKQVPVIWLGPQAEMKNGLRGVRIANTNNAVQYSSKIFETDTYLENFFSLQKDSKVTYLSKLKLIDFKPTDFMVNGNILFSDRDHWSTEGEKVFGQRMIANEAV